MQKAHLGDSGLEERHVHTVYEDIAEHFAGTRYKPWPKVAEFLETAPPGSLILDLGCGNGKYSFCLPEGTEWIGADMSLGLLGAVLGKHDALIADRTALARREVVPQGRQNDLSVFDGVKLHKHHLPLAGNRPMLYRADVLQPSVRAAVADVIICIAVVHHLASNQRQKESIERIRDLLRPGGRAMVTVWAMEQAEGTTGARRFESQDVLVPWYKNVKGSSKPEKRERYYHLFTGQECRDLIESVDGILIEEFYWEKNNWSIILRKVHPNTENEPRIS